MPTARCWTANAAAISASPNPGRARCARSMATTRASSRPISRPTRASTSPATAAAAMPTAITGSPAASTTSSTSPAIAWAPPKSRARWWRMTQVSEAAVVGYPHDIKGQGIYAYVTLMTGTEPTEALRKELVAWVRKDIGPIASPDLIQFAPGLPKTRSGKIMRRILRKIAEDEPSQPRRHLDAGRSRRGRRSRRRTGRTRRARRRKALLQAVPGRSAARIAMRCEPGSASAARSSGVDPGSAAASDAASRPGHSRHAHAIVRARPPCRAVSGRVLFSSHLLCSEHFLCCPMELVSRPAWKPSG